MSKADSSPSVGGFNSTFVIILILLCVAVILGSWWVILNLYGMELWPYTVGLTGLIILIAFVYMYLNRRATHKLIKEIYGVCEEFAKHHNLKLEKSKSGTFFIFLFKHPLGGCGHVGLIIPRIGKCILCGEWALFDLEKQIIGHRWHRKELESIEKHTLANVLEEMLRLVMGWEKGDWQHERKMSEEYLTGQEKFDAEWQDYPVPILN